VQGCEQEPAIVPDEVVGGSDRNQFGGQGKGAVGDFGGVEDEAEVAEDGGN
jgi:hypothetical protein